MENIEALRKEVYNLNKTIDEQKKLIEEKDMTIETLDRELVKCKTEYELLDRRNKELRQEIASFNKVVEDVKAIMESKDNYIKSLEEEKKRLTMLNIGFLVTILILIALFIIFTVKG